MSLPEIAGRPTRLRRVAREGAPEREAVLIHGFGADMGVWLMTEPALARHARLTLYDLPGHGGTGLALAQGDLAEFSGHLAALLDAQGLARPHLIAHSFGAAVALHLAATRPGRVSGLSLIAPAGLGAPVDAGFLRDLPAADTPEAMRAVLGRMLARPERMTPAMAADVLAALNRPGAREALAQVAALIPTLTATLAPLLPALDLPVHVLRGAADAIVPDAPLPFPVQVIPGAGHLPQLEAPAAVNAALAARLA